MANTGRNSHFLGAKLRALRKQNHMTLEELSQRCVQLDAQAAPSVSYLSMIESGRRVPAEQVMLLLAKVFQRSVVWFFDQNAAIAPVKAAPATGGAARAPLEPAFLFSKELLKAAIPELLAQTGTSGRQFAQLLIRSYQESSRNEFPDLERAAEDVGQRTFPLTVDDLAALCEKNGLTLRWFERQPVASGGEVGASEARGKVDGLDPKDVLNAWRDFECSFFAGALLCPKQPFRRLLMRERYRVEVGSKLELTPAVIMRRMTKVSPYPYWHFFDAYPPGLLRAVYRGNGIPLPWGNMTRVSDPCPNWAVFRLLRDSKAKAGSQISVLRDGDRWLLYCCHSLRTRDMAGNLHVLSVGVDLIPALEANGIDAAGLVDRIAGECQRRAGAAKIPRAEAEAIGAVANVLNIEWVREALGNGAQIICPRNSRCARDVKCDGVQVTCERDLADLRQEILASLKG